MFPLATPLDLANGFTMVVFFLDGSTLVNHPFVLFLRSKCYGMVEREFFCLFVLLLRRVE